MTPKAAAAARPRRRRRAAADPGGPALFEGGGLLPGEQALLEAIGDPAEAAAAAAGGEVRGAFLAALLRGDGAPWRAPLPVPLHVSGITVSGPLRLEGLREEGRLHFERCDFPAALCGDGVSLESLAFTDCRIAAASFRGARLRQVRLERVEVGGHLAMDDLVADRVSLIDSRVRGMLSLAAARVERDLSVTGSRIGTGKKALQADHLFVGRTIRLGSAQGGECRADGAVSLMAARFEALLIEAAIEGPLDLRRTVSEAVVAGARATLGTVLLDRAALGDLEIADGVRVDGTVAGANIIVGGDFRMGGRHSCCEAPAAIDLAGARIAGDLRFTEAFRADGPIRLHGGSVGGNLIFKGQVAVTAGNGLDLRALDCVRLEIGFSDFTGGISVRHGECSGLVVAGRYSCPPDYPLHLGTSCSGRVTIGAPGVATEIAGTLSLIGLSCHELSLRRLSIAAWAEGRWAGVAVAARHLEVATLTRFGLAEDGPGGLGLAGHAALDHALFGDDLRFCGVEIAAPPSSAIAGGEEAPALSMRNACARGDVEFTASGAGDPVRLSGGIVLDGLRVDGALSLGGLRLQASAEGSSSRLSLRSAAIDGALRATGLQLDGPCRIDLGDAAAGSLEDGHGRAWASAQMEITRFRYGGIEEICGRDGRAQQDGVDLRLAWISVHEAGRFSPHPYRTLVAALRAAGHVDDIGRVEMAARVQRRRNGSVPALVRIGNLLLEWTSGYGYSPVRATATLVLLFLVGWTGTTLAASQGAFEPSLFMDSNLLAASAGPARPGTCPWLDAPLYAIDLIMPLVALGHENLCSIRPGRDGWQWAATVYRLVGWVVVSLVLLTFAGILRKEV
jgi:cytoskeletal protein CcmA (bactofilin family)